MASDDQLCFEKPVAKSMLVDLQFGEVNTKKLSICQESYLNSEELNKLDKLLIDGLQKDKVDLLHLSDEYKERYTKTNEQLIKLEKSRPSRITWMSVGVISTLVLGLITTIAIK